MISLTSFVHDLFCLANEHLASGGAGDGRGFERRVDRYLVARGIRSVEVFSGVRSLGSQSLSGLYHQIDATCAIRHAVVIGEWKAYRGAIPKNELLRFKAATDDYWLRQYHYATAPVIRIFGGTGYLSPALRRYAAQWGICLITPGFWPAPLLASDSTLWSGNEPDRLTRRYLTWLTRPLGAVYEPKNDGSWSVPKPLPDATLDHFLHLHDLWSTAMDRQTGRMMNEVRPRLVPDETRCSTSA
jgi:hypothetical protein